MLWLFALYARRDSRIKSHSPLSKDVRSGRWICIRLVQIIGAGHRFPTRAGIRGAVCPIG